MLTLNFSPSYENHLKHLASQQNLSIEEFVVNHLPPMPVYFDVERMEQAINSEWVTMPDGLSREEMRQHILETARKHREKLL